MNKFITTDVGGLPIQLDDFRFIDDSVRNALKGIMSAYGIAADESFILSGAGSTLNGPNFDIAAGYISLDGEILEVTAHSITTTLAGGEAHVWALKTSFDSAGLKTFESTSSFNTYQERQAEVIVATISPPQLPMLAENIFDKTREGLIILKQKVVEIGNWNLTTNTGRSIPHGLADHNKIRSVTAMIQDDDEINMFSLTDGGAGAGAGYDPLGSVIVVSVNIIVNRRPGGFLDNNTDFDATSFNRGWITIEYEA